MHSIFKRMFKYLNDQDIDIRIRMMFFLEYAVLLACSIGTICMILLKQPVASMLPNILLFIMSFIGLYISQVKRQYDLATFLLILGCANFAVPWMFFTSGGNDSGMHIWFFFSVVVTCMMSNGKIRIFMSIITIIEDIACICIAQIFPETVTVLVGENAVFYDSLQSYAVASISLAVMLIIYITTYDNQRRKLELQSDELRKLMQIDALTGLYNRRAYYDEINTYKNGDPSRNFVLVAMDVNGLKKVNDLLGHASGDEYICAAANVINQALGEYGHVFRTGGDEFMAILRCSAIEACNFEERLNENIVKMGNEWSDKMAIAVGIVCHEEDLNMSIDEIEKLADKRMYENKAAYYRKNGIDRRR